MTEGVTQSNYTPGTIVFAKLKGYPWWPARIESDQEVPEKVLKKKARNKSALYNVLFYGSRDYGFFGPEAIRPFDPANVQVDLEAKKFKTKDLELAIRQALDPTFFNQVLLEEKEENLKDVEEENKKETVPKQRGRKKKSALNNKSNEENQRGLKRQISEETSDNQKKKKCVVINEIDKDNQKRSPEYRKVYHLRHKLQRLVYNKKEGDIPVVDYAKILDVVKEIEKVDMNYVYLRDSKICKVVKAACFYPFETEVEIKQRCQNLMRNWKNKFLELQATIKSDTVYF